MNGYFDKLFRKYSTKKKIFIGFLFNIGILLFVATIGISGIYKFYSWIDSTTRIERVLNSIYRMRLNENSFTHLSNHEVTTQIDSLVQSVTILVEKTNGDVYGSKSQLEINKIKGLLDDFRYNYRTASLFRKKNYYEQLGIDSLFRQLDILTSYSTNNVSSGHLIAASKKSTLLSNSFVITSNLLKLRQLQSFLRVRNFEMVQKETIRTCCLDIYEALDKITVHSRTSEMEDGVVTVRRYVLALEDKLNNLYNSTKEAQSARQDLQIISATIQEAGENALFLQKAELKNWGVINIVFLLLVILSAAVGGIFLLVFFVKLIRNNEEYKALAQKKLYEKQKFLDDIITNSSSLISVKNSEGNYIVVNNQWQSTFGISYKNAIGKSDKELFSDTRQSAFSEFEQRALNLGISQQVEETFVINGIECVYLSNIFPILNESGLPNSVCSISISLTPLREVQKALERSERDYKTIVANVPGIVFHCKNDASRTMIVISDGVKVLTGIAPDDFLSNSVHFVDIILPEDLAIVRDEVDRATLSRRPYEIEYRIVDKKGRIKWVYERGGSHVLTDSNEVTLQGVIVDITEQKLSLDSVNSRDRFLAGVADAVKELIVNPAVDEAIKRAMRIIGESANVEHSFVFRNQMDEYAVFRTSQLFVWHKGKIAPSYRTDLQGLDFEHFVPRWYHILSEKNEIVGSLDDFPVDEHPYLELLESGSVIIVPVFTRNLFWGFIGFGVVDRSKSWSDAERAIFKAFSVTLGIAIAKAEDATALKEAKETAEAATKTKSDFLARMSHEIRTPMNAIIGWTHLAMEKEINAIQSDYLRKIQSSSKALLGIINDILDFSKIEADKLTIEHIEFDLEDVMNDLSSMVSYKGQEKKLEMVFSVAPNVPLSLTGDPLRLTQVLVNLVNNAVKFTARGEIVVNVKVEDDADGLIILRFDVKDTGIGLTEEQLVNLFDSFSQADVSTTRKYGGTGLGLAICKRLTALMGGDIWVESQHGVGSTFSFTANFGLQQIQKKNRAVLSHDINGLNVLICDNNASSVNALAQMLKAFKCNPIITYTAKGALHELNSPRTIKPDIIFIDWKVDQIEDVVLQEVDGKMVIIDTPIIAMLSNYNQGESVKNVKSLGLGGILYKPFNYSTILDVMMDALGKTTEKRIVRRNESGYYLKALKKKKGLRVLLVEDNETNQQIGLELIMMAGIKVDIASNGQEAIQMVQNSGFPSKYCLVFMDIQMPIMDGYKATLEIRKLGVYENLPIIAMTADAIGGALERYLKVGMDGMVPKPIDPEEMYKAILEWSERNTQHSQIHKLGEHDSTINVKLGVQDADVVKLPEIEGLNVDECLNRLVGRIDFFQRLLTRFYFDHLDFEERFLAAKQANDQELALRMLHSFKGTMGTIAAVEIYPLSIEVEASYIAQDTSFDMKFKQMVGLLNRLLNELANNQFIVLDQAIVDAKKGIYDGTK